MAFLQVWSDLSEKRPGLAAHWLASLDQEALQQQQLQPMVALAVRHARLLAEAALPCAALASMDEQQQQQQQQKGQAGGGSGGNGSDDDDEDGEDDDDDDDDVSDGIADERRQLATALLKALGPEDSDADLLLASGGGGGAGRLSKHAGEKTALFVHFLYI